MSGKLEDSSTGRTATQKATNGAAWVMLASRMPSGAVPLSASSGNVGNASAAATLTSAAGVTAYVAGFTITGAGATAAAVVTATLTNTVGGTLSFTVTAPAGATTAIAPLVVQFDPPLAASAANTNMVLTLPALGAGNTNASVSIWGYRV